MLQETNNQRTALGVFSPEIQDFNSFTVLNNPIKRLFVHLGLFTNDLSNLQNKQNPFTKQLLSIMDKTVDYIEKSIKKDPNNVPKLNASILGNIRIHLPHVNEYLQEHIPEEDQTIFVMHLFGEIMTMLRTGNLSLAVVFIFREDFLKGFDAILSISERVDLLVTLKIALEDFKDNNYISIPQQRKILEELGDSISLNVFSFYEKSFENVDTVIEEVDQSIYTLLQSHDLSCGDTFKCIQQYGIVVEPEFWLSKANTSTLCLGLFLCKETTEEIRKALFGKLLSYTLTYDQCKKIAEHITTQNERESLIKCMLLVSKDIKDIGKILNTVGGDAHINWAYILSYFRDNKDRLVELYDDISGFEDLIIAWKKYMFEKLVYMTLSEAINYTLNIEKKHVKAFQKIHEFFIQNYWQEGLFIQVQLYPLASEEERKQVRSCFKQTYKEIEQQLCFVEENFVSTSFAQLDHPFALWVVGQAIEKVSSRTLGKLLHLCSYPSDAYNRKRTDLVKTILGKKDFIREISDRDYQILLDIAHEKDALRLDEIRNPEKRNNIL